MASKAYRQTWCFRCLGFLFKRSCWLLYLVLWIVIEQGLCNNRKCPQSTSQGPGASINHLIALFLSKVAVNTVMSIARVKKTKKRRGWKNLSKATEGPMSTPQIIQMPQDPNATGCTARCHISYAFGNQLRNPSDLLLMNDPHGCCATCLAQMTHCT